MNAEILTPEEKLFDGEVELVQVPGTSGSFEIMKNHAPIISTLTAGNIKIVKSIGGVDFFKITKGVVEVKNNNIIILAERS